MPTEAIPSSASPGTEPQSSEGVSIGPVMREFFALLDDTGIHWAVLRGSEGLPDHTRYDVDLLIEPEEMNRAESLLARAATTQGWVIRRIIEKLQYRCCLLSSPGSRPRFVPVDFFGKCLHRFYPIADSASGLSNRRRTENGVWVVPPGFGAALTVIKELMRHDTFKANSRGEVRQGAIEDSEAFLQAVGPYLGEVLAGRLLEACQSDAWDGVERLAPEIRRAVMAQRFRQVPSAVAFFAKNLFHSLNPPMSAFVVLLGPDGAGKTTIADLLTQRLYQRPFKVCRRFEYNFRLLPELKELKAAVDRLLGRQVAVEGPPQPGTKGSGMNPEHPGWRAMLYITYYSFDLMIGRLLVRRLRGQGGLILFARYFHDYYYQKGYSHAPRWFLRFVERVVPQPDLILYLHRNADDIYAGKPELSPDEIKRQQNLIQSLVTSRSNALVVDASGGIEATVDRIADLITQKILRDFNV